MSQQLVFDSERQRKMSEQAITLEYTDDPCEGCGSGDDCRLLNTTTHGSPGIVLCHVCRIRVEAMLRAGRKGGFRVGKWEAK